MPDFTSEGPNLEEGPPSRVPPLKEKPREEPLQPTEQPFTPFGIEPRVLAWLVHGRPRPCLEPSYWPVEDQVPFEWKSSCFCSQAKVEDVYNKDDPFELDALLSAPSTESDRAALTATAEVVVEAWQYNLAVKPS